MLVKQINRTFQRVLAVHFKPKGKGSKAGHMLNFGLWKSSTVESRPDEDIRSIGRTTRQCTENSMPGQNQKRNLDTPIAELSLIRYQIASETMIASNCMINHMPRDPLFDFHFIPLTRGTALEQHKLQRRACPAHTGKRKSQRSNREMVSKFHAILHAK